MSHLQQSLNASSVGETLATYERWATTYNQDLESEGYAAPQVAAEYVSKYLSNASISDVRILDAGCGTGLVGQHLAKLGARHIDGLDLSPGMLQVAQDTGVYESLKVADLSKELDIASQSYDVLTCVGTLTQGHVGPEALDEFVRAVRPGGVVIASVRDSVWEKNGYKSKVEGFIAGGKVRLLTDGFETRRVAAKEVDLVYVVVEILPTD